MSLALFLMKRYGKVLGNVMEVSSKKSQVKVNLSRQHYAPYGVQLLTSV